MDEYISREALRDVIEGTTWYHVTRDGKLGQGAPCEEVAVYKATDILKAVIFAPAADVVEVRHGEWIYHDCVSSYDGTVSGYSCSECNIFVREEMFEEFEDFYKDYCGHCGAKMDGKRVSK